MSQLIVYCGAGDCWADKDNNFDATGAQVYVVDSPGVVNSNVRSWFPFVVPLRGVVVTSAYITVTADATSSTAAGNILLSCEASDNVSTPANGAALNAVTLSAFNHTRAIGQYVTDTEYTYQIDNPIQETISRSGWRSGNTLAVIIDEVDLGDAQKSVYSYEGDPNKRAYLTINYTEELPRASGVL